MLRPQFILLLFSPFSGLAAQEWLADGWTTPYYLADPSQGKWSILNPCLLLSQEQIPLVQTTIVGPLPDGRSLTGFEAGWPAFKRWVFGIAVAGSGKFQLRGFYDSESGATFQGTGQTSYTRGLYGGAVVSAQVVRWFRVGTMVLVSSRDYATGVENVPGLVGGVLFQWKPRVGAGISAGSIRQGDYHRLAEKPFVSAQAHISVWKGRLEYAATGRWQDQRATQVQNVVKVWIQDFIALRLGYDPADWNIGGMGFGKRGYLEYYFGKGIYHHLHVGFRLSK